MATFAYRIKELRTGKNLSQLQLAEQIGMTKQTISLWERGVRTPNLEMMTKLSSFFNVSLKYIIGTTDDPDPNNEENNVIWVEDDDAITELETAITQLTQLSRDTRQIIVGAIREAYRLDKIYGRLRDGYEFEVRDRVSQQDD